MKIHTSVKFSGSVIGYHYEFETAMSETELIEYKDKVFQFAISRFKQKNEKDFREDFARCVYFEVYFFKGSEKVLIGKKFKKMEIELMRLEKQPTCIIGKLYVDSKYICDTVERTKAVRGSEIIQITNIPEGLYGVRLSRSIFEGICPVIIDAPNYEHVYISDKYVCGGVMVVNPTDADTGIVYRSAFEILMSHLTDCEESITIKIH